MSVFPKSSDEDPLDGTQRRQRERRQRQRRECCNDKPKAKDGLQPPEVRTEVWPRSSLRASPGTLVSDLWPLET